MAASGSYGRGNRLSCGRAPVKYLEFTQAAFAATSSAV